MTIAQELKLKQELSSPRHEALLGLLRTAQIVTKIGERFFGEFGITMSQYNILIILRDYPEGLSQSALSERQLVNRSNITGLVDRMEKAGLVERQPHPTDRRSYLVRLTGAGDALVERVEPYYIDEVERVMGSLEEQEARSLARMLEAVRSAVREEF